MPITILIVDDNALVRAALRQVLESEGLGEIVEAENGKEAIIKAIQVKPDLIILDLAMPFLDGLAAAREIGSVLPGVPMLMHTLYWSPRVQVEALKAGVRKTVPKSDSKVLIAAVRELLQEIEESRKTRRAQVADPNTIGPAFLDGSQTSNSSPMPETVSEDVGPAKDPQRRAS